jgi:hypothetical protein
MRKIVLRLPLLLVLALAALVGCQVHEPSITLALDEAPALPSVLNTNRGNNTANVTGGGSR